MSWKASRIPWAAAVLAALALPAAAAAGEPVAEMVVGKEAVKWAPKVEYESVLLIVAGPAFRTERRFRGGETPYFELAAKEGAKLRDGVYKYELRVVPPVSPETREKLAATRAAVDRGAVPDPGGLPAPPSGPTYQAGYFSVREGAVVQPSEKEPEGRPQESPKAHQIPGNLEVLGDLAVRGTKKFVTEYPGRPGRSIAYVALEGPEAGTYYRGSAVTVAGEAVIELPGHFAAVTEEGGLTVQLTPLGGWARLYVAEKSPRRLVVRDAAGGDGVGFDFLVQGVRSGYADFRPDPKEEDNDE